MNTDLTPATIAMFHRHLVAAYTVVWVVQLGYLVYVVHKWLAARRTQREISSKASQRKS